MKILKIIIVLCVVLLYSCNTNTLYVEDIDVVKNISTEQSKNSNLISPKQALPPLVAEYEVSPKFGKPNVTNYTFKVYDFNKALGNSISVKLYERATGIVTYYPMVYIAYNWVYTGTLPQNGWFDYRYVYTDTKNPISTTPSFELCNTRINFIASGTSSIFWSFGADGSSWSNRLGWYGSMETMGCGSRWESDGHIYYSCQADDRFAEDWNKNCGTNDDSGAEFRSPLDGQVIYSGWRSGGYGYCVDIKQKTPSGSEFVFRIAHLQSTPTTPVNAWVKAGVTNIGNIGMTGGTSTGTHAHCALYSINSNCYYAEKFSFNAQ